MRSYVLPAVFAATALAAGSALAQRPDSAARADSIARRDSVLAERERGRIRGERVRTTVPQPAGASDGRGRRFSWRGEVGTGLVARYSQDPDGADVGSRIQPLFGVGAAWDVGRRTRLSLAVRASAGPLRMESDATGDSWDGGTVKHADLLGAVEWTPGTWGALRGGVGTSWLRGPSLVVPFRYNNYRGLHPSGVLGASAHVSRARPLDLFLDLQGIRYGAGSRHDPVQEPGTVTRFILGLRYGR
jgi:hypothetical protein